MDLVDRAAVFAHLADVRPDALVLAAAKVGGIVANDSFPAEFLSENLRIQVNVMDAARDAGVRRLLFLGSSCIYPKYADQPTREDSLLTGPLEPTNDAYAVAKIAAIMGVQSVRKQYGLPWISAMPTNLYGPGDNSHPEHSHVLPALIRRFDEAARSRAREVVLGAPAPRAASSSTSTTSAARSSTCSTTTTTRRPSTSTSAPTSPSGSSPIVAGYDGEIVQDTSRPDGTPRKLLDTSRITALGWEPTIGLRDGIAGTHRWFVEHHAEARLAGWVWPAPATLPPASAAPQSLQNRTPGPTEPPHSGHALMTLPTCRRSTATSGRRMCAIRYRPRCVDPGMRRVIVNEPLPTSVDVLVSGLRRVVASNG
ncbi:NAD-dependent epimerase/dehydratase family protein [Pseudonocardia tropica]|uniref:NAD-dependent epimerase/dehydratase family protein n=1 Tax=Pseudonocardia tropica TaxID=681289 RepID=A0ABV1JXH5_9PSEU